MARPLTLVTSGLLSLILLARAGHAEPPFRLDDSSSVAAPEGKAVLVLTREQFARVAPLPAEPLYLDGAPLGFLPQRAFLAAVVMPGRHCLSGLAGIPAFWAGFEAGDRVLLRLRETLDDADHLQRDWLRDDPERIEVLIRDVPLKHASTTGKGRRALAKRSRPQPAAADSLERNPLVIDELWYERPLDTENLRSAFRKRTWRLTLDSAAVHLVAPRGSLDVPIDRITGIHFSGVRYGSFNPWLDIEYQGEEGPLVASIADSRSETSAATYNRIFTALLERRRARAAGASAGTR